METLQVVSTVQLLEGSSLLSWRRQQLQRGGRRVDFDWLLDLAGGLSRSSLQRLLVEPQRSVQLKVSLEDLERIWGLHLDQAIPLQHLVGFCPWRDVELTVSAAALIPRQETELLVDLALQTTAGMSIERWADLGTGSGALAIALSRAMPATPGHAVDLSADALAGQKAILRPWLQRAVGIFTRAVGGIRWSRGGDTSISWCAIPLTSLPS